MKKLLLTSFLLVSTIALCSCSDNVSKEKYSELEEKYDKLQSSYDSLSSKYKNLSDDYDKLEDDYSDLEDEYLTLEEEYNVLISETTEEPATTEETNTSYSDFKKEDFRTDITYENLARTPDDYYEEQFTMSGRVIQVIQGETEAEYRIAIDDNYDNIVYLVLETKILDERILEEDWITFYAISGGLYTYESTFGGNITVPCALGIIVERN